MLNDTVKGSGSSTLVVLSLASGSPHGPRIAAAPPDITPVFQDGRRKTGQCTKEHTSRLFLSARQVKAVLEVATGIFCLHLIGWNDATGPSQAGKMVGG